MEDDFNTKPECDDEAYREYARKMRLLSDRELYGKLWHRVLTQDVPAIDEIGFNEHVDLSLAGDDDWSVVHLRYYADEDDRLAWSRDFPDDVIPPHEDPPYDRDRLLPQPYGERRI